MREVFRATADQRHLEERLANKTLPAYSTCVVSGESEREPVYPKQGLKCARCTSEWINPVNPSQPGHFRKELYPRHWPRLNPGSFPQPCLHWSRSPGGTDLRSAVLLRLQIFISTSWEAELRREQHGTANTDIREQRQFTSLTFVSLSSLESLSLCPFSSPSCQISIHHKHWLFPPSSASVSPTHLLRRPQQCVVY